MIAGMASTSIKPRWVHAQNFRLEDKEILERALMIAEREKTDLTHIIRIALSQYVKKVDLREDKLRKLDEFLSDSQFVDPYYGQVLTPERLKQWEDGEVLQLAKKIRGRKEELEAELRRRRYYFRW
jgi:hypothetical protein